MREIKFRAWDFGTEEMISVDDIQFYNPEEVEIDVGIFLKPKPVQPTMINTKSAWRVVDGEDVVLMQYTGLHDKNGKEVYEGDVCVDDDEGLYEVKFDEGAFVSIFDGNIVEYLCETAHSITVIGNIYKNPELLK